MISALPKTSTPAESAGGGLQAVESIAVASEAAAPFDFIMALETLAAQAADQQALTANAALVECGELLGQDEDGLESADEDLDENSLEFLAGLLTMAATRTNAADEPALLNTASPAGAAAVDGLDCAGGGAAAMAALLEQGGQAEGESQPGPDTSTPSRAHEILGAAQRAASAVDQSTVATHVRDPRWADDFSARVTLLVRAGESQAALQLTPVDLGPVDVNVTVRDSQATIHFGATNAETRALLEASLPKLREMLAAQGFNLLDASVSQGFTQKGQPESAGVPRSGLDPMGDAEPITVRHLSGLLDLYA